MCCTASALYCWNYRFLSKVPWNQIFYNENLDDTENWKILNNCLTKVKMKVLNIYKHEIVDNRA